MFQDEHILQYLPQKCIGYEAIETLQTSNTVYKYMTVIVYNEIITILTFLCYICLF
jgi:hypothetical protein